MHMSTLMKLVNISVTHKALQSEGENTLFLFLTLKGQS